jgi:diamine N-acetyltransferase
MAREEARGLPVELREITAENWLDCAMLEVSEEQKDYVWTNSLLMLQAKYELFWSPWAVYAHDKLVGFVMYSESPVPLTDEYWILQLMIDRGDQGLGYGQAALDQVLARLLSKPDCREIWLSCHPANSIAIRMYRDRGFELTGRQVDGEICLCRKVKV